MFALAFLTTLILASLALAQSDTSSSYDPQSGSQAYYRRNPDGSLEVRGFNSYTGSYWRQTITPNGDYQGTDSTGNRWRYNKGTGSYIDSQGTICWGSGKHRECY